MYAGRQTFGDQSIHSTCIRSLWALKGRGKQRQVGYPRGVLQAQQVEEGDDGTSLLNVLPVAPLHAEPPQYLCCHYATVPAAMATTLLTLVCNYTCHIARHLHLSCLLYLYHLTLYCCYLTTTCTTLVFVLNTELLCLQL